MKKISTYLMIMFVLIASTLPINANAQTIPDERLLPRLVDEADLLTESEETSILAELDSTSEELEFDIVIVTAASLNNQTAQAYADDFFDYNGYGMGEDADGILLLLCPAEGERYISTTGACIDMLDDAQFDTMTSAIIPDIDAENYAEACMTYIDECRDMKTNADKENDPLPRAMLIALIVAGVVVFTMVKKHKSVHKQRDAVEYIKSGSVHITEEKDRYLYSHVTKTKIEKNNSSSSHRSSSGRSHGGGSF